MYILTHAHINGEKPKLKRDNDLKYSFMFEESLNLNNIYRHRLLLSVSLNPSGIKSIIIMLFFVYSMCIEGTKNDLDKLSWGMV